MYYVSIISAHQTNINKACKFWREVYMLPISVRDGIQCEKKSAQHLNDDQLITNNRSAFHTGRFIFPSRY